MGEGIAEIMEFDEDIQTNEEMLKETDVDLYTRNF